MERDDAQDDPVEFRSPFAAGFRFVAMMAEPPAPLAVRGVDIRVCGDEPDDGPAPALIAQRTRTS